MRGRPSGLSGLSGLSGTRAFHLLWAGQTVSILGSELTGFALGVWIYRSTESVTQLALVMLATLVPGILLAPVAGACVDRLDRRFLMLLGDSASALCTLAIAGLLLAGRLDLWHTVPLLALMSASEAFQSLVYLSLVSQLVPPEHLGRANGLLQIGQAVPRVLGPALAGGLLQTIGLMGVILADFASYGAALTTLLLVRGPARERPAATDAGRDGGPRVMGWRYLAARPALLGILVLLAAVHFSMGMVNVAGQPLVLSFASPAVLGGLLSVTGAALVSGGLVMSLWRGPERLVHAILAGSITFGIGVVLAGLRPSVPLIAAGLLALAGSAPIVSGYAQALWQAEVPLDLQGRVFAVRDVVTRSALLLAYLAAGPLADRVFEPRLATGGAWADRFGWLVGVGPGRGVALLLMASGALPIAAAVAGYFLPALRLLEDRASQLTAETRVE